MIHNAQGMRLIGLHGHHYESYTPESQLVYPHVAETEKKSAVSDHINFVSFIAVA